MSNVFFTSDLHFDHHSLVDFRRGVHSLDFISTNDMNEWLVEKWNSRVRPKDMVWVLGDISWSLHGLEWLKLLNGHKRLVLGNHDTEGRGLKIADYLPYFETIHGAIKKYGVVMTHVPIHPNELCFRWETNVHGHIHHKERMIDDPRYINVNVDVRNGLPISLEELRQEIKNGKEEQEESTTIQT